MNPNLYTKTRKIAALSVLVLMALSPFPYYATVQAQENPITVPNGTGLDPQSIWAHLKAYGLDGAAWAIAKIAVARITASTVQWINSGFQGSPAYLTNPEGYFQNVGDQATGAMIQNLGLSQLCSPFSVDVRLAIALGQAGNTNQYACTLTTVINNAQNASINGMSVQGFMNGDFSQGGWPAFIALSQPNNNESGVYLQAESNLLGLIGAKQNSVNHQLAQGQGFLSWQSCTDVASGGQDVNDANGLSTGVLGGENPNLPSSLPEPSTDGANGLSTGGSSGSISIDQKTGDYQSCQTETPGSVINSQLEKQLGSGVDQLNLTNSFNEIAVSLLDQLVTQVLNKGLGSATQKSSGETQSYINELEAQANGSGLIATSSQQIYDTFSPYIDDANQTVAKYQQIIALFTGVNADYAAAETCYQNLASSTGATGQPTASGSLATVQASFASTVAAAEATYQTALQQAEVAAASVQAEASSTSDATSAADLEKASTDASNFVLNGGSAIQQNLATAQADLTIAQTDEAQFDAQAQKYLQQCQSGQ